MPSVKPRKVGSSTVLTVPKGIKADAKKYDVVSGEDGAIVFLPHTKNPFTDAEFIEKNKNSLSDKDFVKTDILKDEF